MCCLQTDKGQGLKTLFERQTWFLFPNNAKLFHKKAFLPLNCASSKAQSAQKHSANMRTKGCNLPSKTDEESRKLPTTERFWHNDLTYRWRSLSPASRRSLWWFECVRKTRRILLHYGHSSGDSVYGCYATSRRKNWKVTWHMIEKEKQWNKGQKIV